MWTFSPHAVRSPGNGGGGSSSDTISEEELLAPLGRREQVNRRPRKLDGQGEAHLITSPVANRRIRAGWTLQLLADRLVQCEIVDSISPETVRQTLKKTNSSLG